MYMSHEMKKLRDLMKTRTSQRSIMIMTIFSIQSPGSQRHKRQAWFYTWEYLPQEMSHTEVLESTLFTGVGDTGTFSWETKPEMGIYMPKVCWEVIQGIDSCGVVKEARLSRGQTPVQLCDGFYVSALLGHRVRRCLAKHYPERVCQSVSGWDSVWN